MICEYIKGSLQFSLEHLAQGLQNVVNYLVGQEQDLRPLRKSAKRTQALRSQLTELRQRMENEKRN